MLKQVSDLIGSSLARQLAFEAPQAEVLSYGMQIVLETVIKIAFLFFIAFLLGLEITTLVVFLAYCSTRTFGGGAHLSTYPRCLTIGCAMLIGFSLLSNTNFDAVVYYLLLAMLVILAVVCIVYWVPAGTEKKRVINPKVRLEQKVRLAFLCLLWTLAILYLHQQGYQIYEQAAVAGILNAFLIITPWGYGLFRALDNTLDKVVKGGADE